MTTIGGEQVTRLTDFQRNAFALVNQLKQATTPQESRVVLTTHGEPVAVVQEYGAYQQLLALLESTQRSLQIAETRDRLRKLNAGEMKTVSLDQAMRDRPVSPSNSTPS